MSPTLLRANRLTMCLVLVVLVSGCGSSTEPASDPQTRLEIRTVQDATRGTAFREQGEKATVFLRRNRDNPVPILVKVTRSAAKLCLLAVDNDHDLRGIRIALPRPQEQGGQLVDVNFLFDEVRTFRYAWTITDHSHEDWFYRHGMRVSIRTRIIEGESFSVRRTDPDFLELTVPRGQEDLLLQLFDDQGNFSNELKVPRGVMKEVKTKRERE